MAQAKYHCDCGWAGVPPPSEYRRLLEGHAFICPNCGGYPSFEEMVDIPKIDFVKQIQEIEKKYNPTVVQGAIIGAEVKDGKPVLFSLGQLLMTPGTIAAFERSGEKPINFLDLHQRGIWGQLSNDDKHENALSLEKGWRLMSAYFLKDGTKIWVITEADRASTTILLPEEY